MVCRRGGGLILTLDAFVKHAPSFIKVSTFYCIILTMDGFSASGLISDIAAEKKGSCILSSVGLSTSMITDTNAHVNDKRMRRDAVTVG